MPDQAGGIISGAVGFDWFTGVVGVLSLLFGFAFMWRTAAPSSGRRGSIDALKQGLLSEDVLADD